MDWRSLQDCGYCTATLTEWRELLKKIDTEDSSTLNLRKLSMTASDSESQLQLNKSISCTDIELVQTLRASSGNEITETLRSMISNPTAKVLIILNTVMKITMDTEKMGTV